MKEGKMWLDPRVEVWQGCTSVCKALVSAKEGGKLVGVAGSSLNQQ